MNSVKRKRRIGHLFEGRFYNPSFLWRSVEDRAWDNIAPVGREFGSPDYDRLEQDDLNRFRSNLARLIAISSTTNSVQAHPFDAEELRGAINVKTALLALGQKVSVEEAAAVWRKHSQSLMAGWMSGAETVASAKKAVYFYCLRPDF